MTVIIFLVASFGTITVASYGIGMRILSFIIIPSVGFSFAVSTLVGQSIGAGKLKRADQITKTSAWIGFGILTLIGIIIFIFAPQLSAAFVPNEPAVIQGSALFVRLMAFTFGLIAVMMIISGAIRGAGNTFVPMILSILSSWVIQFPLAYILSKHTSLAATGLWLAFSITNVIMIIITVIWYLKGNWRVQRPNAKKKLVEEVTEETIVEEGVQR